MWGETGGLMLLFWSALIVGGRVVRWEGRKGGKGGRVVKVEKVGE